MSITVWAFGFEIFETVSSLLPDHVMEQSPRVWRYEMGLFQLKSWEQMNSRNIPSVPLLPIARSLKNQNGTEVKALKAQEILMSHCQHSCFAPQNYLCSTTHQYKHSQWLFPHAVYFYIFSPPVCLIDARAGCYRQLKIWQECLYGHCCKLSQGLSELFSSGTGRGSCKSCKKSSEILWCGCDRHRNRAWLCLHLLFPISILVTSIPWTAPCVVKNSQNP